MTDLEKQMEKIRSECQELIHALEVKAQLTAEEAEKKLREAVARAGFHWCGNCNGTGAIERLDAGYMRRFGMREWNGCESCGGDGHEKRGKGFVAP